MISPLDAAATFSEFGLYYFVFGLFAVLGIVMLALILLAEPDPQYDIDSLPELTEDDDISRKKT
jgi:hypothetical protein